MLSRNLGFHIVILVSCACSELYSLIWGTAVGYTATWIAVHSIISHGSPAIRLFQTHKLNRFMYLQIARHQRKTWMYSFALPIKMEEVFLHINYSGYLAVWYYPDCRGNRTCDHLSRDIVQNGYLQVASSINNTSLSVCSEERDSLAERYPSTNDRRVAVR